MYFTTFLNGSLRFSAMLSALELRRQLLHILFGLFLVVMLSKGLFTVSHLVVILVLGLVLSYLCKQYYVPLASWVMDHFEREENRKTFPGKGPILFVIGSIIVVSLFPLTIALASMMILTVGDALSHIFGKLLSRKAYATLKSVEGTLIGILSGFVVALVFVDNAAVAFVGAFTAMAFEGVNFGVDDNLWIPIIAATSMSLFLL